jgi:hypothetical protein
MQRRLKAVQKLEYTNSPIRFHPPLTHQDRRRTLGVPSL